MLATDCHDIRVGRLSWGEPGPFWWKPSSRVRTIQNHQLPLADASGSFAMLIVWKGVQPMSKSAPFAVATVSRGSPPPPKKNKQSTLPFGSQCSMAFPCKNKSNKGQLTPTKNCVSTLAKSSSQTLYLPIKGSKSPLSSRVSGPKTVRALLVGHSSCPTSC